jgi:hypothetical protein
MTARLTNKMPQQCEGHFQGHLASNDPFTTPEPWKSNTMDRLANLGKAISV